MKYYLMNKNKELMILQQNDDDFLFEQKLERNPLPLSEA